jgi:hypothetical protein
MHPSALRLTLRYIGNCRAASLSTAAAHVQRTTCGLIPTTTDLVLDNPQVHSKIPMYQVMDVNGKILPGANYTPFTEEMSRKMYRTMVRVQSLDDVFYNAQVNNIQYTYVKSLVIFIYVSFKSAPRPNFVLYAECR